MRKKKKQKPVSVFGDGSDGVVVIGPGADLVRDKVFRTLTEKDLFPGVKLKTKKEGYRIYARKQA